MVLDLLSTESLDSGFIGRQPELAALTAALDDVLSGKGQVAMLAPCSGSAALQDLELPHPQVQFSTFGKGRIIARSRQSPQRSRSVSHLVFGDRKRDVSFKKETNGCLGSVGKRGILRKRASIGVHIGRLNRRS